MSALAPVEEQVPMVRMDVADRGLLRELLGAVERVASGAAFTLGEEVAAFEREWADWCGARHAVGVSSGTDALVLALRALDIGRGDEVVVPANSFVATAEAVSLVGAEPRFADVDADTATLTAATVEPLLGPRTRCVVPVHLHGRMADMAPLLALAADAGVALVEDAAQAHGARCRGRHAGTLGQLGCFSFYPSKNLGAWGDGGAVVTDDARLARRVRLLRTHGALEHDDHRLVGTTARLDAVQAAVLRVKLRRLEADNALRRALAARLDRALAGGPVALPAPTPPGHDHVFHHYVVRSERRDAQRARLAAHGVATAVHYPVPIHRMPAYAAREPTALPIAERLAATSCSLPLFPAMREQELARVAAAVLEAGG